MFLFTTFSQILIIIFQIWLWTSNCFWSLYFLHPFYLYMCLCVLRRLFYYVYAISQSILVRVWEYRPGLLCILCVCVCGWNAVTCDCVHAALSAGFGTLQRATGAQNGQKKGVYPLFPLRQQTLWSLFKELFRTTKTQVSYLKTPQCHRL